MTQAILTSDERQRIWLYFLNFRMRYAIVVLFLGLVLAELALGKALLLVGLLWLGGALVLEMKRPASQEIDELFSRELKSLVQKALHSLAPSEHGMRAAPLALYGPAEQDAPANGHLFIQPRVGREGGYRSPVNRAVILLPMEDHLGIYSCQHNSLNGLTSQEAVEEHHYRDVVTVRLEEGVEVSALPPNPLSRGGGAGTHSPAQVFSLEFTNGRRLSIPVSVTWQEEPEGEAASLSTGLDKTVTAIRALMRDKR